VPASSFTKILSDHVKTAVTPVTSVTSLKTNDDLGNHDRISLVTSVTSLKTNKILSDDMRKDEYEERAAILEYEAGMTRAEAEREARKQTNLPL